MCLPTQPGGKDWSSGCGAARGTTARQVGRAHLYAQHVGKKGLNRGQGMGREKKRSFGGKALRVMRISWRRAFAGIQMERLQAAPHSRWAGEEGGSHASMWARDWDRQGGERGWGVKVQPQGGLHVGETKQRKKAETSGARRKATQATQISFTGGFTG